MVKINLEGEKKEIFLKKEVTVAKVVQELGKNTEDYLTILNGEVVTELETISDKDHLKLVRVWSGG